jgi:hypothetical protein
VQAIYEQITVRGSQVLRVKLTPMAEQVGLPALLPENVRVDWVMAPPDRCRVRAHSLSHAHRGPR